MMLGIFLLRASFTRIFYAQPALLTPVARPQGWSSGRILALSACTVIPVVLTASWGGEMLLRSV